jgi:hypothetical protein
MTLCTEFITEHVGFDGKWHKDKIYYMGDLTGLDFSTDERFKAVFFGKKPRRKQAVCNGVKDIIFPEIVITNYEDTFTPEENSGLVN